MLSSMTNIFTEVFNWLKLAMTSILEVFVVDGNFTILGVLALIALAISIFFLLVGVISNFLHLRG